MKHIPHVTSARIHHTKKKTLILASIKPASHICHGCHLLRLFDLNSNHTHFIQKAFITTSLLDCQWTQFVQSPRSCLCWTSPHMDIQLDGVQEMIWIRLMKLMCSFNFMWFVPVFFFLLFEETSNLNCGSLFCHKKKKKMDGKVKIMRY